MEAAWIPKDNGLNGLLLVFHNDHIKLNMIESSNKVVGLVEALELNMVGWTDNERLQEFIYMFSTLSKNPDMKAITKKGKVEKN